MWHSSQTKIHQDCNTLGVYTALQTHTLTKLVYVHGSQPGRPENSRSSQVKPFHARAIMRHNVATSARFLVKIAFKRKLTRREKELIK